MIPLNSRAVTGGAAWSLALVIPATVLATVLDRLSDGTSWSLLALLVWLVGYLVGGGKAAQRALDAPFANGGAAGFLAAAVHGSVIIARNAMLSVDTEVGVAVFVVGFLLLAGTGLGLIGAWFGARRA